MSFTVTATVGADGMVHVPVPGGAAGAEYEVTVVRRPTPEELGWPPGYFETTFGSISDPAFVAPTRSLPRPVESWTDAPTVDVEQLTARLGRAPTPEELGWPPGYFETVCGSIDDPTFERAPQGEYEKRDEL